PSVRRSSSVVSVSASKVMAPPYATNAPRVPPADGRRPIVPGAQKDMAEARPPHAAVRGPRVPTGSAGALRCAGRSGLRGAAAAEQHGRSADRQERCAGGEAAELHTGAREVRAALVVTVVAVVGIVLARVAVVTGRVGHGERAGDGLVRLVRGGGVVLAQVRDWVRVGESV